jgi:hypothetical protein
MKTISSKIKLWSVLYWDSWKTNPAHTALTHIKWTIVSTIISVAATVAMYFHGIPHLRYCGETSEGQRTYWSEPGDFRKASYISFPGSMNVLANEYSQGCSFLIWIPIDHIEGLDQKLPFSIIRKAEDRFRGKPASNTRRQL